MIAAGLMVSVLVSLGACSAIADPPQSPVVRRDYLDRSEFDVSPPQRLDIFVTPIGSDHGYIDWFASQCPDMGGVFNPETLTCEGVDY